MIEHDEIIKFWVKNDSNVPGNLKRDTLLRMMLKMKGE